MANQKNNNVNSAAELVSLMEDGWKLTCQCPLSLKHSYRYYVTLKEDGKEISRLVNARAYNKAMNETKQIAEDYRTWLGTGVSDQIFYRLATDAPTVRIPPIEETIKRNFQEMDRLYEKLQATKTTVESQEIAQKILNIQNSIIKLREIIK